MPKCHFDGFNLWILKPTHLNRGRGIHVFRDLETLNHLIKQYCTGKQLDTFKCKPEEAQKDEDEQSGEEKQGDKEQQSKNVNKVKFNTFIIQKYIEKPLLIYKRKFDIRVWVCLTQD